MFLQVVLDPRCRIRGGGPLIRRDHRGVEIVLREVVQLVHIGRELLHDLRGLACDHRSQPNDEQDQGGEQDDQQEPGGTAPAPAPLLVQPGHRRLEREREQYGEDQVVDEGPLLVEEPQRRQGEQHGTDRVPDGRTNDIRRGTGSPVSIRLLGRGARAAGVRGVSVHRVVARRQPILWVPTMGFPNTSPVEEKGGPPRTSSCFFRARAARTLAGQEHLERGAAAFAFLDPGPAAVELGEA